MKTRVLPFTAAVVALLVSFQARAQFEFATINGGIVITGYWGSGGAVTIPTNLNGLPVSSIASAAFYEQFSITSLTIPDTVTNIGDYACYECANLAALVLPTNLTTIGNYSFQRCSMLRGVTIPSGVTGMGAGSFANCSNLTSIALPAALATLGIDEFSGCTALTNVTIPPGVAGVGEYAFSGCARLKSVAIPGSVTNIGYGAFLNCSGLSSVTLPGGVSSLGQYAFYNCSNLASVYFAGPAPQADLTVFEGDRTTAFYVPGLGGWSSNFAGISTSLWTLPAPMILTNSAGMDPVSGQFGFSISWATNVPVIIKATTTLGPSAWQPVATNFFTNGLSYFSDPASITNPACFYRISLN